MASQIEATVVEDSVSPHGVRLTTLQLRYPRFIHSEFMTHRVFSRNASSSRAIPVSKLIDKVRSEPALPIHWGKNVPGMQAKEELDEQTKLDALAIWRRAATQAADSAEALLSLGLHKQVANRILEPFCFISVIVTATEWDNFFLLRDHADAQPEIQSLASEMRLAMNDSIPVPRSSNPSDLSSWHLPYVRASERAMHPITLLRKLSAARCARVSYLTHDGGEPDLQKDMDLYRRLVEAEPKHASPVEHQAIPAPKESEWHRNFRGWVQFRELIEAGHTDILSDNA